MDRPWEAEHVVSLVAARAMITAQFPSHADGEAEQLEKERFEEYLAEIESDGDAREEKQKHDEENLREIPF